MNRKPLQSRHDELRYTQNFLHSAALVDHIVSLADIRPGDTVLEIGPGKGIITKRLAEAVGAEGAVVGVELDSELAERLRVYLRPLSQVTVVTGDILRFDLSGLPDGYLAFANVPFNITSALLETLFNAVNGPDQAHLILQEDSIAGVTEGGAPAETFKSLMIAPLYRIALVHPFEKSDFIPQPGVETALFAFTRRETPLVDPARYDDYKDFLAVVSKDRAGEGAWRKLFSKAHLDKLVSQAGLVDGRGLKSQSAAGVISAFDLFMQSGGGKKHDLIRGAMAALRDEQTRREQLNRAGGHRRSTL